MNLFGFDSNKKSPSKSNNILLPLDTLILLGVVIILLLTIAFSLGVEKGRRTSHVAKAKKEEVSVEAGLIEQAAPVIKPEPKSQVKVVEVTPAVEAKEIAVSQPKGPSYIIRLATYTKENKDLAVKEMEKLKEEGFPAGLSDSGKYLILIVGEFTDRAEVDKKLAILKKTYKDCYIKKVR